MFIFVFFFFIRTKIRDQESYIGLFDSDGIKLDKDFLLLGTSYSRFYAITQLHHNKKKNLKGKALGKCEEIVLRNHVLSIIHSV